MPSIEQARYDIAVLPSRQRLLHWMLKEDRQTIDGIRAIERELEKNRIRIEAARLLLQEDWM